MRSTFGQGLLVVVLIAVGAMVWRAGQYEQRIAAAQRDLVTLRYDRAGEVAGQPAGRLAALVPGEGRTVADAKALGVAASYWQRNYAEVASNPEVKLLAANAAYRAIRQQGGPWQTVVGRLDAVVKSYAEVLRQDPANTDAAFNHEYAVRLRAAIATRKQPVAPMDAAESTLTIHGNAGAPPSESDTKKFKMIVPMRPDERLEAEKAGKGTTKVRKG